jgi:hypothetical protein
MENNSIVLVNLVKYKCQSLTVTTDSGIDKGSLESLGFSSLSRIPISYYQLYKIEDKNHLMRIRILPRTSTGAITISVIYHILEQGHIPVFLTRGNRDPLASEQFTKLCQLDISLLFCCETVFLNKRDEEGVIIMLPMKFPAQPSSIPYDEIRGMRIVKIKDGRILIENNLDLVDDDTMSQKVKFAYEAKFTSDLPLTLLQESKKLTM